MPFENPFFPPQSRGSQIPHLPQPQPPQPQPQPQPQQNAETVKVNIRETQSSRVVSDRHLPGERGQCHLALARVLLHPFIGYPAPSFSPRPIHEIVFFWFLDSFTVRAESSEIIGNTM